jgi:hypothetical protein
MKKKITLKESELIFLIERMVNEGKNTVLGKTVKDLRNVIDKANPDGFLIMVDGDEGKWVSMAAHLNTDTYGYRKDGVDITQDNTFVSLPYYEDACLSNKSKSDWLTLKDESKYIMKHKRFYNISTIQKQLEKYPDDTYLMLFDGSLVSDIKLNGGETVGFKSVYGNSEMFKSNNNDFIFIVKGEKTKKFFRLGEKQLDEETGSSSVGGFESPINQPIKRVIGNKAKKK